MSNLLFSFTATPHEARRLNRLLKKASKQDGDSQASNKYFGLLCKRYGHTDPESCQITIVTQAVIVTDYPSIDEIAAAHREAHGNAAD